MNNWLYVFNQIGVDDIVKIGFSKKDPVIRLKQLNTGSPLGLEMPYCMLMNGGVEFEKKIHNNLIMMNLHKKGEWFNCKIETAIIEIRKVVSTETLYEEFNYMSEDYIKKLESCDSYYHHILAAEQGTSFDQNQIAELFDYKADSLEQNYKQAFYWYLKAAEQGHAQSQYSVATMYNWGQGVEKNYEKAAEWYFKAAEKDHVDARFNLDRLYEELNIINNVRQSFLPFQYQ